MRTNLSPRLTLLKVLPFMALVLITSHPTVRAAAVPTADLVAGNSLRLGTKSVDANGQLLLTDSDSFLKSNGKCAFNLGYDMRNQGGVDTPVFLNRVFLDSQLVAQNTNLSLTAGQARAIITQPYLTPGSHVLKLVLDADNQVAESNEANNTISVSVKVDSTCGGTTGGPNPVTTDLGSLRGISIGGTTGGAGGAFGLWGGQLALKSSSAFLQSGGKCAFNMSYDLENTGSATQQAFVNRLMSGATLVGQQTGLAMGTQETRQIMTQAYLAPGSQVLTLLIDADKQTGDINRQNNEKHITVTVDGKCDGSVTPPSGRVAIASVRGMAMGGAVNATGGQFAAWGGTVVLADKDAFVMREGKCGYNFSYDLENIGSGASTRPFASKLYDGDTLVAEASGLSMMAGTSRQLAGQLGLAPGKHELRVVIDSDVAAPLGDRAAPKLQVYVTGQCRTTI